jgi:hypothetical protein
MIRLLCCAGKVKKAAREYLKNRYTQNDKVLYCQICKQPMPFRLADGNFYFEAVEWLKADKRHKEGFIALCPTDAAKFKHANASKDNTEIRIKKLLARTAQQINNSDDDNNKVHITLANTPETLAFSPNHLIDLKAILD